MIRHDVERQTVEPHVHARRDGIEIVVQLGPAATAAPSAATRSARQRASIAVPSAAKSACAGERSQAASQSFQTGS